MYLKSDSEASLVYQQIQRAMNISMPLLLLLLLWVLLTRLLASLEQLHAFTYRNEYPIPKEQVSKWNAFDCVTEFERLGVGTHNKEWRFSTINADFEVLIFVYLVKPMHLISVMR
jgi:Myotubularin-like phosphatase domain